MRCRQHLWIGFVLWSQALANDGAPFEALPFLQRSWNLSAQEIAAIERGDPVGKLLRRNADGEVAILGVIRLSRSKEEYLTWYRNVENYKLSPMVVEVGPIGNPPETEAADRLQLEPDEINTLRICQPAKCGAKLTGEEIERLRAGVDWSAPDAAARANLLSRQMLLDYAGAYWRRGHEGLGKYRSEDTAVDLAATFRGMLDASPFLRDSFPELFRELYDYRGAKPGAADEFVYWSRERYGFGLKPLVNLFHITIRKPQPAVVVIASKQIRSNHYFDGSLSLVLVADAPGGRSYLIFVNRSRVDLLRGGGFGGFKRKLFEWQLPREIKKQLLLIRKNVEGGPRG